MPSYQSISLVLAFLISLSISAKEIRLDVNGPFQYLPIYDQSFGAKYDSEMCYAFAGSQFMDAIRIIQGGNQEHHTSPIVAAINSRFADDFAYRDPSTGERSFFSLYIGSGKSGLGIGHIADLYYQNRTNLSCDLNYLQNNNGINNPNDFWKIFREEQDNVILRGVNPKTGIENTISRWKHELNIRGELLNKINYHTMYSGLTSNNSYPYIIQQNIYKEMCKGHTVNFNLPEYTIINFEPDEVTDDETDAEFDLRFQIADPEPRAISMIDQALDQRKPALIDICSKMLINYNKSYKNSQATFIDECGMHSVIVIGKRTNSNGDIKYLIRNSWGNFDQYDPLWEVDEKKQIWVTKEALSRNILNVLITK